MFNIYWKWNDEKKILEGGGDKIIKIGMKIEMICTQISFIKHECLQWKVVSILN
jgi:hypothetical protein